MATLNVMINACYKVAMTFSNIVVYPTTLLSKYVSACLLRAMWLPGPPWRSCSQRQLTCWDSVTVQLCPRCEGIHR